MEHKALGRGRVGKGSAVDREAGAAVSKHEGEVVAQAVLARLAGDLVEAAPEVVQRLAAESKKHEAQVDQRAVRAVLDCGDGPGRPAIPRGD